MPRGIEPGGVLMPVVDKSYSKFDSQISNNIECSATKSYIIALTNN